MCVGCWAGVTSLRYTVLTSPTEDETAVHCCDPALSVLVMLVSRNVFHVVSTLQSIVCHYIFWLRSLVDFTLAAFFVCGPLQFLVSLLKLTKAYRGRKICLLAYHTLVLKGYK